MDKLIILILTSGFFLIALTLMEFAEASNGHKQRYGENCSRNKKCDFTKWLRCQDGKCICYERDKTAKPELYYDYVAERCVGRSGTNCSQKFFPFDDDEYLVYFNMRGSTTNHWRYGNGSLRCGANAFCEYDSNKYECICKQNYFGAEDDGRCYRIKSHGDPCTKTMECDPDGFLECLNGQCICADNDHKYDANLNKCIVPSGSPCQTRINRLDKRVLDDCMTYAHCEEGVCKCEAGTQLHSDRTCQRGFGRECDPDHPCGDTTLACKSKVCQCKYPMHMVFDETVGNGGRCVSIAGGPCHFNDTSEFAIHCTRHAECVMRGLFSECKCAQGYLQTIDGLCVKVFGSDCVVDTDCDRFNPLACVNSRCVCPDLLLRFDPKTRKCKGLVGSRCRMDQVDSCVENATCNKFDELLAMKSDVGKCLCNRGYKETTERTCTL